MLDFFRDAFLEHKGIDAAEAHKQRVEKREQAKLARFIFSKKSKVIIFAIVALFLPLATTQIVNNFGTDPITVLAHSVLLLIATTVCVCLLTGRKQGEVIALVGSVLFIVIAYINVLAR